MIFQQPLLNFHFFNSDVTDSIDWSFYNSLIHLTNICWALWESGHILGIGKKWHQTCFSIITPMSIDQPTLLLAFCISVMRVLSFWLIRPATKRGFASPDSWINITLQISTWTFLGFSSKKKILDSILTSNGKLAPIEISLLY